MMSDSSFVSSTMRLVKPLFTKTLFQPVTADVVVSYFYYYVNREWIIRVERKRTIGANDRMNSLQVLALVQL